MVIKENFYLDLINKKKMIWMSLILCSVFLLCALNDAGIFKIYADNAECEDLTSEEDFDGQDFDDKDFPYFFLNDEAAAGYDQDKEDRERFEEYVKRLNDHVESLERHIKNVENLDYYPYPQKNYWNSDVTQSPFFRYGVKER